MGPRDSRRGQSSDCRFPVDVVSQSRLDVFVGLHFRVRAVDECILYNSLENLSTEEPFRLQALTKLGEIDFQLEDDNDGEDFCMLEPFLALASVRSITANKITLENHFHWSYGDAISGFGNTSLVKANMDGETIARFVAATKNVREFTYSHGGNHVTPVDFEPHFIELSLES